MKVPQGWTEVQVEWMHPSTVTAVLAGQYPKGWTQIWDGQGLAGATQNGSGIDEGVWGTV